MEQNNLPQQVRRGTEQKGKATMRTGSPSDMLCTFYFIFFWDSSMMSHLRLRLLPVQITCRPRICRTRLSFSSSAYLKPLSYPNLLSSSLRSSTVIMPRQPRKRHHLNKPLFRFRLRFLPRPRVCTFKHKQS